MSNLLTMPKLSPTMEEGTIVKWHKKEGDAIKAGDVLFEVATDKATVEHSALDDGFLRKILIQEGNEAKVNDPVAVVTETKDESIEDIETAAKPAPQAAEKAPEKPAEVKESAPAQTSSMQEVGFAPADPLTDYKFEFNANPQDQALASPLAKKLAKEQGLDISGVKGTGPGGRIVKKDLDLAQSASPAAFGPKGEPKILPGTFEEEKLTPMRKAIGAKLQASKTFVPHFYIEQEINASGLFDVREQLKAMGQKVTYNDFVIRACSLALREQPVINSGYNSVDNQVIRFKTVDIAVAVTIEEGLITPIVRHADFKNLGQISAEVKQLASLAKENKLKPEQYTGGSFTVSNLGMLGITNFTAVINPPQAAILAVGGMVEKPIVLPPKKGEPIEDSRIGIGKTMQMTLSCDHRVIDGMDGAKFIKRVQELLENPAVLLI